MNRDWPAKWKKRGRTRKWKVCQIGGLETGAMNCSAQRTELGEKEWSSKAETAKGLKRTELLLSTVDNETCGQCGTNWIPPKSVP